MTVCPNGHDSVSDDFCDLCGMRLAGPAVTPMTPAAGLPPASRPVSGGEPCPRCGTVRSGRFCEACGFNFGSAAQASAFPTVPRFTPVSPAPVSPAPVSPAPVSPAPVSPAPVSPAPVSPAPVSPAPVSAAPVSAAPVSPAPVSPAPAAPAGLSSFPYPQITWTAVVGADRGYYERVQAVTGPEGAAVVFPSYCGERRFALLGNQMRIGRRSVSRGLAPEIDLTGPPADPGISRLHAVLIAAPDGGWAVLDPGSANGTLINGAQIPIGDQVALQDGDRINLGAWTAITVHRDGP
jgi:FHA domain